MDRTSMVAFALLVLAVALDLVAGFRLLRSDIYTAPQKVMQLVLVVLLPLIGAIVILSVMNPPVGGPGSSEGLAAPDMPGTSSSDASSHTHTDPFGHGDS